MAPETCKNYSTQTDSPIDIWSMGIILYQMIYGEYPFQGSSRDSLRKNIKQKLQRFDFPADPAVSPELKDLLDKLLRYDPMERATIFQIIYHPWLRMEIKSEETKKREVEKKELEEEEKEESKVEESTQMDSNLKSGTTVKLTSPETIIEEKEEKSSEEWKKEQEKLMLNLKKVSNLSVEDDLGEQGT